jgi:hypothetical protein
MINKILIVTTTLLAAAVIFLFIKVFSHEGKGDFVEEKTIVDTTRKNKADEKALSDVPRDKGNAPTGQIAYVNIDVLNEKSMEVTDLIGEAKRRKANIEASVENLSMQYQTKMQEYQASAKAGIAPPNEMAAKEKEIMALEKEAQNKQLQMDNLTMDISEKNADFQQNIKTFLRKWNNGKYDFILSYSDAVPTMLLGNASLDITPEIIDLVNAEYKAKKVKK